MTLLLPASAAALEPLAAMGGGGGLVLPLGIAVDGTGGVYASEHVGQRVSRFTTAGVFAWAWGFDVRPGRRKGFEVCTLVSRCKPGSPGGRAGQLGFPGGIAADRGGDVYVSDPANDRISRFTTAGVFVSAFGFDVVPGGGKGLEVCMAIGVYRLQYYTLRDLQGRLEEIEPEIRDLVARYPARPVFRCALIHVHARLDRVAEAQQALDAFAQDGFVGLPFDQEWLYGISLLAETAGLLGDSRSAAVLYPLLVPWAAFTAADHPEGYRGSVSRHLGALATLTQRWDDAERHFEVALTTNSRSGARPWLAHTEHDYARMLHARNGQGDGERAQALLDAAWNTYQELGMESYAASAATLAWEVTTTTQVMTDPP